MDDGNLGAFTSVDNAEVENKDYLRSHTVTLDVSNAGKQFRFKLGVKNEIGEIQSSISSQILAGPPAKPTVQIASDASVTNTSRIKATWGEIVDNGGDDIISYSLEIDDGLGGDFVALIGYEEAYLRLEYTIEQNIGRAVNYRLRYRATNRIGWSPYSDIVFILAANRP